MARVNSTQKLTGVTVERQEALIDSGWNLFKTVMVFLGGLAILGWLIWLGYTWGSSGCYTCTQNKPSPVATATHSPSSGGATETATAIAELEKARLALEKAAMAAEEGKATQVNPSSTAAPAATPPPSRVGRRALAPPEATASRGSVPPLSSAERRRNEMWSALRR